jgi:hypothetical protein
MRTERQDRRRRVARGARAVAATRMSMSSPLSENLE